jgi:pimeloyl-ACP methyl ester carboxylesterase
LQTVFQSIEKGDVKRSGINRIWYYSCVSTHTTRSVQPHGGKSPLRRSSINQLISKDGTVIAFYRSGKGPAAVMLVGGAFQYRAIDPPTVQLAALLALHFTVFHHDRRGRGDSGDTQPFAIEREIEDLEALINEAGGSAFVFGMSSGGTLAIEAVARGLAITKLACYEIPFNSGDEHARLASEHYTRQLTALLTEGRRGDAVALAMTTWGAPAEAVAGMRQTPIWPLFESVAPTLAYDDAIMGDGSVPAERLASIMIPTLVMDGGASLAFMHNAAQATAHALPNAKLRTLEGQTHDVAPEVLAPILEQFLKS